MKFNPAWLTPAADRDREPTDDAATDPLAEYLAECGARRAAIMDEIELRRMTRDVVVNDADALVTTPDYPLDAFIDDMRRYVAEVRLWQALYRLCGGKVIRGDYDDAVAVWYHEKGGKFSDIAARVLAGEFADHDRYENLNLRWPEDDDDEDE